MAPDVDGVRTELSSHCISAIAPRAPRTCATTNIGTLAGAIPAKVFVSARAIVTAGLANEVEAVNQ
jgi:poly(A) polymerase Pap1